ncbi:hypothetical protein [Streptomyces sp. NPDC093097]|uniref:hypothetical protein n=1 Tax=Streptomyces sp. NPDC093097 TaxID=3366027 RepID=UPI003810837A
MPTDGWSPAPAPAKLITTHSVPPRPHPRIRRPGRVDLPKTVSGTDRRPGQRGGGAAEYWEENHR